MNRCGDDEVLLFDQRPSLLYSRRRAINGDGLPSLIGDDANLIDAVPRSPSKVEHNIATDAKPRTPTQPRSWAHDDLKLRVPMAPASNSPQSKAILLHHLLRQSPAPSRR